HPLPGAERSGRSGHQPRWGRNCNVGELLGSRSLARRIQPGRGLEDGPHGRAVMKISIIVEGSTETVLVPHLRTFLQTRLADLPMPKLDVVPENGRIPTRDKLKRKVQGLLTGKDAASHVIALTDVYTGSYPPDFDDAHDAKQKMREWVGHEPRFHPHAAQHD